MNLKMEEPAARFHFSRWEKITTTSAVFFSIISASLLAFGVAYAIPRMDRQGLWFALVVTGCLVGYLACLAGLRLKYRYIMDLDYTVSVRGIHIADKEGQHFVPWSMVEVAEYMPLVSVFRIFVRGFARPVVLFTLELGGGKDAATQRSRRAENYIRGGMGGRLRRRWVPW